MRSLILLLLLLLAATLGCVSQRAEPARVETASDLYARANATPFKFMYMLNSSVGPITLNFTIIKNMSMSYTDCYDNAFVGLDLTTQASEHKAYCALISVSSPSDRTLEGRCYCELLDWAWP